MKRIEYPLAIRTLVAELKRMPGIGPRSAERIAVWMMQARNARPTEIARSISEAAEAVRPCRRCGFFASGEECEICSDPARDQTQLCIVEQPTDILPLERTGAYRGLYHALGGRLSPLDHVGPEDLRIAQLQERVTREQPRELILGLSADVEGEATANYLLDLLQATPLTITRLAQGLPAGGGLESADQLTLSRALSGRTRLATPAGG